MSGEHLVQCARLFSIAAHSAVGQTRKYTGEPYWKHTEEVANIVRRVGGTSEMIAAAYLHDTVEDTGVTNDLLSAEFGPDVARLVWWLTDISKPEDGNRAARKALDCQHIALAPASAMTVKLADIISNTRSIMQHDKKFAQVYIEEKRRLLAVLTAGDTRLLRIANSYVEAWDNRLNIPEDYYERAFVSEKLG